MENQVSHADLDCDYQLFGLRVRSPIVLPQPAEADGPPDIVIGFGPVPPELSASWDVGLRFQAARGKFLLTVDGIARFLVQNGKSITIDRSEADDDDLRCFLLGSVLAGLLQQREDLVLRGSTIQLEGRAIALVGPSGSGKSTLAIEFQRRGYPILSDQHFVLRWEDSGERLAQPGYPRIALWPDALRRLNIVPKEYPQVRRGILKRWLPLDSTAATGPLPVQKVYLIRRPSGPERALNALAPAAACQALSGATHAGSLLQGLGLLALHCQMLMTLVATVPVMAVVRPMDDGDVAKLADLIEADFERG